MKGTLPPMPPNTEAAFVRVRKEQDACHLCDPIVVPLAHTVGSRWRNCFALIYGYVSSAAFLTRTWLRTRPQSVSVPPREAYPCLSELGL